MTQLFIFQCVIHCGPDKPLAATAVIAYSVKGVRQKWMAGKLDRNCIGQLYLTANTGTNRLQC